MKSEILTLNKKIFFTLILFAAIFLIGASVRFYNLSSQPGGFFCDEAGLSYYAYLIGKDGRDESGEFLPFYMNIFSPRGPVAIYDQVIPIKILGLSEFSSRFTSALTGTLTIISIFLLAYLLFNKNLKAGLFASFITAISPWHIHFSRFGAENIRLPFYFSIFLITFIYGVEKDKKILILVSAFFAFVAFYSYTPANLFLPPFILGLLIIFRKYFLKFKKFLLFFMIVCLLFSTPFIKEMYSNFGNSRFSEVSVFNDQSKKVALEKISTTYVQSFSPDFLFLKGDVGMPNHFITRFSPRGIGELYLITVPFIIFGLFLIIKDFRKNKHFQVILLWLALYPIGSAIAGGDGGGPFATRSIIGVLVFQLITAWGIVSFINLIKKKKYENIITIFICLCLIISFINYLKIYFVEYPKYSEDFWGWQFGARDIMKYYIANQNYYDELIFPTDFNAPDIFPKFYSQNECYKCRVGLPETDFDQSKKQLFSLNPEYIEKNNINFITLKYIFYANGNVAFQIGEIVK